MPILITLSAEERAIRLYQEIMRVSRDAAEHAYMLIEASLAPANRERSRFNQSAYNGKPHTVFADGMAASQRD